LLFHSFLVLFFSDVFTSVASSFQPRWTNGTGPLLSLATAPSSASSSGLVLSSPVFSSQITSDVSFFNNGFPSSASSSSSSAYSLNSSSSLAGVVSLSLSYSHFSSLLIQQLRDLAVFDPANFGFSEDGSFLVICLSPLPLLIFLLCLFFLSSAIVALLNLNGTVLASSVPSDSSSGADPGLFAPSILFVFPNLLTLLDAFFRVCFATFFLALSIFRFPRLPVCLVTCLLRCQM
jgi:hypothetical protein